ENVVDNKPKLGCGSIRTRLIQALRTNKLLVKSREKQKDLPTHETALSLREILLCSCIFYVYKRNRRLWDVLSAALAVIVVEYIGALMHSITQHNWITKPMKSTLQAKPKKKTMETQPALSTEEDSNMANEPSRTRDCHLTLLSSHPSLDLGETTYTHSCNETLVIWGAKTKFRLENHKVEKGYAQVLILERMKQQYWLNSSGMAHALVNVDPVRSTFFIGCQDSSIYAEQLRYSDYKNMERSIILSCLV
ncbi:hypothetical protein IGI04_027528, partial [Brassica rapa subsp. trilocularis]